MADTGIKETGSIVDKTVLLRVNFRTMGNSRKVSSKVLTTAAVSKLLKIQKTLLDSPELTAITKADNQMRQTLYALCVPYDMGLALLPRVLVNQARDLMVEYRDYTRVELVNAFVIAYPVLCENAKAKLQELATELEVPFEYLYNPNDYPHIDAVKMKFGFDWEFLALSIPDELKLAGKYEEESAKIQNKIAIVTDEITVIMRQTLLDLVAHLKDALEPNSDGKPKRLFATAVTNIQDFLDTFKARNITNDTDLDTIAGELGKLIHPNVNTDMLKKDDQFKGSVHDGLANIADKLTGLVEVIPGRKFRHAAHSDTPPDAITGEVFADNSTVGANEVLPDTFES